MKVQSRLKELREKFAQAASNDALENLFEAPTRNNLIAVLKASTRPQAHALAHRIEQCRPGRKTRCKLTICPSCGPSQQRKEKLFMWQRLISHNGGEMPSIDDLSYVTVDGFALTSLDSNEIIAARNSFHTSLKNCRANRLPDTAWVGLLDMGLGDQSAIHAHMIVHHPGITRKQLRSELKAVFNGDRAVCVSEWYKNTSKFQKHTKRLVDARIITLDEANLDNVTAYITKLGVKPPKESYEDENGKRQYRVAPTIDQVADRLIKLVAIRGSSFMGARIKLGIKTLKGSYWRGSDGSFLHTKAGVDHWGFEIFNVVNFKILKVMGGMFRKLAKTQERKAKDKEDQEERLNKMFTKLELKRKGMVDSNDCQTDLNGVVVVDSNDIGRDLVSHNHVDVGRNPIPCYGRTVNRTVASGTRGRSAGLAPHPRPLHRE